MNQLITLITPTGGRQECFALCAKFVNSQDLPARIQWIVVDDCTPATVVPQMRSGITVEYIRGPKPWKAGYNTQRLNLDVAISKIRGDFIFFIEDDDYYAKNYLSLMVSHLMNADIVGEADAKYYNMRSQGYKRMNNFSHASLSQTGITKKLIPTLDQANNSGELYTDLMLWKRALENNSSAVIVANTGTCVGMKGLPGRLGITPSHTSRDFMYDPEFAKLIAWVGESAARDYIKLAASLPKKNAPIEKMSNVRSAVLNKPEKFKRN